MRTPNTMEGNYRNLLQKFCLDGSVLGLKYFYLYPDKISRFFWSTFVLAILYMACLLTYLLYRRFEAMPTRITIENQFEPIAGLPFPAITLCSPNQMTMSAVQHFDETLINGNRSIDLRVALPQLLAFYHFVKFDLGDLTHLQELIELNRYAVPEVMALLPQSCDQFLRMCHFKRHRFPNCRGLFRPILTKDGLCCIFNSPYYYKTNKRNQREEKMNPRVVGGIAGFGDALTVITDFNPHEAVDNTIYFAGATKVMFTDWTEFPADDESLLVPPNTESFHLIHATATYCSSDVKELPPLSRRCLFEDERHLEFFHQYRNSDCDLLCLVHAVQDRCGCLLFYLPHLRTANVCDFTDIKCASDAKLNLNEWMEKDHCKCPRDCDSRQYTVDVTMGNMAAIPYMYKKNARSVQFNRSTSIMHFVFPAAVYKKQKQETVMSYTTLASNLGGVFGLCMGCSVISVLEILFFVYTTIRNYVRRRVKRRQAATSQQFRQFYYD